MIFFFFYIFHLLNDNHEIENYINHIIIHQPFTFVSSEFSNFVFICNLLNDDHEIENRKRTTLNMHPLQIPYPRISIKTYRKLWLLWVTEMLKWTVSRSLSTTGSTPHATSAAMDKSTRRPFRDLSNTPPTGSSRTRVVQGDGGTESSASRLANGKRRRCRSHGSDLRAYFNVSFSLFTLFYLCISSSGITSTTRSIHRFYLS